MHDTQIMTDAEQRPVTIAHMSTSCSFELKILWALRNNDYMQVADIHALINVNHLNLLVK